MPSSILDSAFLKDLYGAAQMRAVFDDAGLLQKWLDVEVALVEAEAEIGVIPSTAAAVIRRAARAENIDVPRKRDASVRCLRKCEHAAKMQRCSNLSLSPQTFTTCLHGRCL